MTDQFLENPDLLKGKPKESIGDYVEQNGFLVPKRYISLAEAVAAFKTEGKPFIARSEHPQDYAGCSGLFLSPRMPEHSHAFRWDDTSQQFISSILDYMYSPCLGGEGDLRVKIKKFCKILQIDYEQFIGQLNFSFWEKIPGFDITVTADSAVNNRYHITTCERNEGSQFDWYYTFSIVENRCLVKYFHVSRSEFPGLPLVILKNHHRLIELYEQIRNLSKFNPDHCPTMEFQAKINGEKVENYFLQYHRTRDFEPADFELDKFSSSKSAEFENVRGKTQKGGIDCKVVIVYAAECSLDDHFRSDRKWSWYIPEEKEGTIDAPQANRLMKEIMSRRRNFQLSSTSYSSIASGHELRSLWFKPDVSVISHESIIERLFLSKDEFRIALKNAEKTGDNQYIQLHVECDGRRAYVQRI